MYSVYMYMYPQLKFNKLANLVLQHTLDIPAVAENQKVSLAVLEGAHTR